MNSQGGHRRRWYVLGVLVVSLLVIVLDNTVLNVALKVMADPEGGLGASQAELAWAINSYTLVFAGLLFTFGVVGDRVGRKRMLIIGMLLFGLSSLVSAYAQSPEQLIWARAAMGLGGAAVMPQSLSIITNVFEPRERGRAIGIWAGAVGIGIAIGPITGGALLEHFWWGSVFLINVPVAVVGVIAIALIVPESRNPQPGRIDPLGVLLSIVGLVALTYGIIQGGEKGAWLEPSVLGPVAAGLVVLALFVWHEARSDHPALDVRLFRDPRLSAATAATALGFFALGGVIFFMTFYLQSVRSYTPLQAGLLVLPMAAAQLIFSPSSSTLVIRYGAKAVCTAGLLMLTMALLGYHFLIGTDTPIWVLELLFFLQGAGLACVMPPATELVMSVVPRERAGAGSAINNTARQVAVALGVAVLGSLVSSLYRGQMEPYLAALPDGLGRAAGESISATMAVAERLGLPATALTAPADAAFVNAIHTTALISAIVAFIGAMVVLKWTPGRPARDPGPVPKERREPAQV